MLPCLKTQIRDVFSIVYCGVALHKFWTQKGGLDFDQVKLGPRGYIGSDLRLRGRNNFSCFIIIRIYTALINIDLLTLYLCHLNIGTCS